MHDTLHSNRRKTNTFLRLGIQNGNFGVKFGRAKCIHATALNALIEWFAVNQRMIMQVEAASFRSVFWCLVNIGIKWKNL